MAKVRPPAGLAPRDDGDEELTVEQLGQIALFAQLNEQPELEQYPGTIVLRRFRAGDVICRLGEPGWTAFYILTSKDLQELREKQLAAPDGTSAARLGRWREDVARLKTLAPSAEPRPVATVHLARPEPRGFWEGLKDLPLRLAGKAAAAPPRPGAIFEGEVFGEMSCLYRTPRSATIVADADCCMLEFLRNIFDRMLSNRNKAFKEQIDTVYRKRVLDLQLRALPLFRDLSDDVLDLLRRRVELKEFAPGELIWDEHDAPDCMVIVRSGFVQVRKNVSYLLDEAAVSDWPALGVALAAAGGEAPGPRRKLWDLLPAEGRAASGRVTAESAQSERDAILAALNALLRQPKLSAAPEFAKAVEALDLPPEAKKPPSAVKKSEDYQKACRLNRRLLEALFPGAVPVSRGEDEARVLAYQSQGDLLGEIGLVTGRPRSAACIAYDHPGSKFGRVELVRIGKELFADLVRASPELSRRVAALAEERQGQTAAKVARPAWDETNPLALSERFDELGLIQGQKLMVIDLERCTRCDECVKACVDTHADGRSRLFLDGPRFKDFDGGRLHNYLVPATCRQCKDPVCLIGCPVGSIHKGENGQIVVEDWCIGCRRCAEQCPYGAVQMHPVGVLPRGSAGWRLRAAPRPGEAGPWQDVAFDDRDWATRPAPFHHDRGLRDLLSYPEEVQFRVAFDVTRALAAAGHTFHLQVYSLAPAVTVWVNGREVARKAPEQKLAVKQDKQERWNLEATLALASAEAPGGPEVQRLLRLGRNVVAVSAVTPVSGTDVLLEAGVYQLARPVVPEGMTGEFTQELVMNAAVVCDMCSDGFGKQPACVNACPHEAALRVDARTKFVARV